MPGIEGQQRTGVAVVDPGTEEEAATPLVSVRRPDGGLSNFDEIVTPHPVVAFLFRRRTFIVLVGLLGMVPFAQPKPGMLWTGIGIAILAECWRIWAAGTIHKTEELTTGGPYAHVRHPLYVGSFLHAIAYGLMSGRWESFLFVLPLFGATYGSAVATEEAMLLKVFGDRYRAYQARVPRLLPRLTPAQPAHGQFCWKQVWANKEYVNLIWMAVLCSLYVLRLLRVL